MWCNSLNYEPSFFGDRLGNGRPVRLQIWTGKVSPRFPKVTLGLPQVPQRPQLLSGPLLEGTVCPSHQHVRRRFTFFFLFVVWTLLWGPVCNVSLMARPTRPPFYFCWFLLGLYSPVLYVPSDPSLVDYCLSKMVLVRCDSKHNTNGVRVNSGWSTNGNLFDVNKYQLK